MSEQLRTDFKDDVLDVTQNEKRKYRIIHNDDGTISLEDATVYVQEGDKFGANELNEMNKVTNQMLGVNDKLDSLVEHTETSITTDDGVHGIRYNEKQLQVNDGIEWKPATVDMVFGNEKKITKIRYGQKTATNGGDTSVTLPENIKYQKAIVYNDLIYAFSTTKCYIFDGTNVIDTLTLPATISNSACIHEWENEIHIFSGTAHYKYDGKYWLTLDILPYSIDGRVVLHKDELHFISGVKHYKYDGETLSNLSDIPRSNTNYSYGVVFDYEDVLYGMHGWFLYKYEDNTDSWSLFKTYSSNQIGVNGLSNAYTILDDKLYIGNNEVNRNSNYGVTFCALSCIDLKTFNATNKCSLSVDSSTTTYSSGYTSSSETYGTYVTYKGVFYSLGLSATITHVYKADCWWRAGASSPIPYSSNPLKIVEWNNELHVLGVPKIYPQGTNGYYYYTNHIKRVDGKWVEDVPSPVGVSAWYCGHAVACSDGIHIMGNATTNGTPSDNSVHYVFDGETWTKLDNLPSSTSVIALAIEFRGKLHLVYYSNSNSYVGRLYALEDGVWNIKWNWSTTGSGDNGGPCVTNKYGVHSAMAFVLNDRLHIVNGGYMYIYGGDTIVKTSFGYKAGNIPCYVSNEKEVFVYGIASSSADKDSYMTGCGRLFNGRSYNDQSVTVTAYSCANWWVEDENIYITNSLGYATKYKLTYDLDTVLDVECE